MSLFSNRCKPFWWAGLTGITVLSTILFFQVVSQTSIDGLIRGDTKDYLAYAFNLKTYGVYSHIWPEAAAAAPAPDALRAPGYPFLLSLFVGTDNETFPIAKVLFVQAALGVLTVIIYVLLYRRFLPTGWALAAGLMTAICPHLINASVYLLTESLFTFLLGAHLLILERAMRSAHFRWALLAGTLLALSFLVRPTSQYLILAYLAALLAWFRYVPRPHWKCVAYLVLPVILAAGAWSARNVVETGRFSDPALTANFLQHGMYINMMYENHPETYGYPYRYDPANQEIEGNTGKILEIIGQKFQQEPRRYLAWLLIGKPIQFFSWNLTESVGDAFIFAPTYSPYFDQELFAITHTVAKAFHPFLMFLGVIGACIAIFQARKNTTAMLLAVVTFYFIAIHIIGAPFPRYSVPLRPISYGLAFFALHTATQHVWTRFKGITR
ncbi:glycosyltransferase family 39 protein [Methylomonas montana]|uniref:glycosyltransferase family 39 protein n=1 Tax=Methylomonas montana TaxID=3058963 RepID=UPI00265809FC|nr:glycosyltransferase family 39 protein [Methylomonas montana]WKJ90311.1 glycosyltransferase family 39 protein [Methylomonas montana]